MWPLSYLGAFLTLCVSLAWGGGGERWVTACLIEHRLTLKSVRFKEVTISLWKAIQHLNKGGWNLHSLINDGSSKSRENFSVSLHWPRLSFYLSNSLFLRLESIKGAVGSDFKENRIFFFFWYFIWEVGCVTFSLMNSLHWSLLMKSRHDHFYMCLRGIQWPSNPGGSKSEVNFPFPNWPALPAPLNLQAIAHLHKVCVLGSEKNMYG